MEPNKKGDIVSKKKDVSRGGRGTGRRRGNKGDE